MSEQETESVKRVKRHLIKPAWLRIPLKCIGCILVVILMLPVLLYIPPVQTAVKNLACRIVREKTGMDIKIDRLSLKFPVDVSLSGVSIVEATGDTMVYAKEAVADVRLMPLLQLDVRVKKLSLTDGYYRFVSPDSSMVMKMRARYIDVDDRSSVSISKSEIDLNRVNMDGGDISLYMDVWKQQYTPQDTTSTPFIIKVNDADVRNVRFAMSMLPTIDTLTVNAEVLRLRDGVINLRTNDITAKLLTLDKGDFKYIAPTPEYVAAHPVPVDTVNPPTPPMTIKGDSVSIDNVRGVYAIKGAKPLPGFDANYIEVSNVGIGMRDFYNQATTVRLPLTRVRALERSGLQVVSGSGLIAIDESGLNIEGARLRTPYSDLQATAALPFALMELQPQAEVNVQAEASLGLPDIEAFMPDLHQYLVKLPQRSPLTAAIDAVGQLDNVRVNKLDAAMAGFFSLRANGYARNALDLKNLVAQLDLDGELVNPAPVKNFTGDLGFDLPALKISGTAGATRQDYTVDMNLETQHGQILADASVGLNSERYVADVTVNNLNVAKFMPTLGIGIVSGTLKAKGAGFNPLKGKAGTDVSLCLDHVVYNNHLLRDISLQAILNNGSYHVELDSPNHIADIEAILSGTIENDDYTVNGDVSIHNLDLYALGMMEAPTRLATDISLNGRLRPERWLYDADVRINNLSYTDSISSIVLPDGIDMTVTAAEQSVAVDVNGDRTDLQFRSPTGLQHLVEGIMAASDMAMRQIDERNLDMESLQQALPPFTLTGSASGSGLMASLLEPSGIWLDTLSLNLANDSLIHGRIAVQRLNTGSMTLDTLSLNLAERGKLLDYKFHMGNAPGTLDEFANVDLNGYLGMNRLSAYLVQRNLQREIGYRLGFTAAVTDSVATLHFTPLKATIAYMPWVFNDDNFVSYNMGTMAIDAKLKASSAESSILLATENNDKGQKELHLNLTNIKVEDFLQMSITAPPIRASVNSDMHIRYTGKALVGKGNLDIDNFIYDKTRVGDFSFTLAAGTNLKTKGGGRIGLKINGKEAMALGAVLADDNGTLKPEHLKLQLTDFPLSVANPFLDAEMMQLYGALNGTMALTGTLTQPILNGSIACDSVRVKIPMIGSSLRLDDDSISVADNLLTFEKFAIYGANKNPLSLTGSVDARQLSNISFDLQANANNFQLIGNDQRAGSDVYGKLFMNLNATVKGPMRHFDVNGNVGILGTTDVYYTIPGGASSITTTDTDGVVKFVNFNDTTAVADKDTVPQMMAMRVRANLTISPGTHACVYLSSNKSYKATVTPSG
ncbi:MAG: translocation/assembly module TamB domain-containing protein, partial [Muribaculaceae bacterium]|nr:translocation/assembly module TamB domain-containing protein [Muribaculaceae bacterium]